jgi:hypothetical protein
MCKNNHILAVMLFCITSRIFIESKTLKLKNVNSQINLIDTLVPTASDVLLLV